MSRQTPAYIQYINSKEWQRKRAKIIKARGNRCQRCRATDVTLQLHHRTYDRLGCELDTDLELLCITCHKKADRVRVAHKQYENAKDTYARKKYGDDYYKDDRLEEEFDRWLERKNQY
jgi:5-methylcytosine-specific restriction endonuclease McrA